ncbi:response regulator [Glaciihabitans arcticus]|uniref:Response regulator n=1 Tax=Glaciihabitans arcticus TaxID=2668039 RepID=A0A4Q9GTL9_9MICO|nr:response regulator [Glaciihabitans arcticus]TBN58382.1 response regulator [Glaciihabitans arcticus]
MHPSHAVRILVVDEENGLTDIVRRALQLEGWVTAIAPTGAEAIAAVDTFEPHIILLDMMLPDMLGTEVATRLRAAGVETPIVFLTGRSEHEDRMAGYASGADAYLTKPFGLDELVNALKPIVSQLV